MQIQKIQRVLGTAIENSMCFTKPRNKMGKAKLVAYV